MSMDGGYYAIKGFVYQFDATIIKIMSASSDDDVIEIENVQDFSLKDEVYQIKYKESQNYSKSKIKKAVLQLLNEWKCNKQKKYYLIAHFKNRKPQKHSFNGAQMKGFFGKEAKNIPDNEIKKFSNKFSLIFTDDYNSQVQKVLKAIKKFTGDDEKALFWHLYIYRYLTEIVVRNKTKNDRRCTRKQILKNLSSFEQKYFDVSYKNFIGKQKYLKYVKKKIFPKRINTTSQKRLFILEPMVNDSENAIIRTLIKISEHFIKNTSKSILGDAPYIIFKNYEDKNLKSIKDKLYEKNIFIVDGYPYKDSCFRKDNLTQKIKNRNDVIRLRIINSIEDLKSIKDKYWDEIYDFSLLGIGFSSEVTRIYIDKLNEINKIL